MSMIESNIKENQRALETEVGRLAEQLNMEETYEPQGITVLDFDDEGEEQNEEFTLHSTNTMEWSEFGSYKNEDGHNYSFEDLISPVKEHDKESVTFKVGEEVMEANTTPYLPTLKEPILQRVYDIRSKEDEECLTLLLSECSNSLEEQQYVNEEEVEFKARVKVSFIEDQYVMGKLNKNSLCKLTHIIRKQVHRKARVGVRNLSQFVCHGKKDFGEVSNYDKLIKVASKRSRVKQVRTASSQRKRKRRV
ncbi:hypothetical protein Tco_0311679 [Tanacetum coccineum]